MNSETVIKSKRRKVGEKENQKLSKWKTIEGCNQYLKIVPLMNE